MTAMHSLLGARPRILIVDDDPASRRALADLLVDEGYEVDAAADADQALARIQRGPPQLVIADVVLPGIDGLELTRRLREEQEMLDVPIVLVSGRGDTSWRIEGLEGGADDVLPKPVDPEELVARLHAHLRRARRHSDVVRMSIVDPLTEVLNRRGIDEVLGRAVERARRDGDPLSVLLVDINDFKGINDTLGHATGDEVLRRVADALRRQVRPVDHVGRIGGDEFVVVLEGVARERAVPIARRLHHVEGPGGLPVSLSVGLAALDPGESLDALLARADAAMYQQKRFRRALRG
jgi:diguanylate cyclase (GGDEF)-like protein